jgi:hypothetical protein
MANYSAEIGAAAAAANASKMNGVIASMQLGENRSLHYYCVQICLCANMVEFSKIEK